MPYLITYVNGRTEDRNDPPRVWAGGNHICDESCPWDPEWHAVRCEWVEPRKEYRWRVTWAEGETLYYRMPQDALRYGPEVWESGDNPVVKVERIEVTT